MTLLKKRERVGNDIDMVNGPLLPNIFRFAVPVMLSMLLQMLFNAADTIVVGKFGGDNALAAVGGTHSLIFLMVALFNGLSVGSNVVVAKLYGTQDYEKVSKAVHTSIWLAIVCSVGLTTLGLTATDPILRLVSTPEEFIDLSALYMKIYFIGVLPLLLYNFSSAILRSKGDTKRPLYFMCISGILNVALNLLFVIVFKMSVAGVAIATVISEIVSAYLCLTALAKQNDATRLCLKKIKPTKEYALDIIRIGIPAGIQGMVFSLSNTVIQSSINSFKSAAVVAGNAAGANIESFVYIGMQSFSQATITFTSQNVGAGRKDRVGKIMWLTLFLDCAAALIVGFLAWYFGDKLLLFYTDDPNVVKVGMVRLLYVALPLFLNAILDIFVNSLRGMGYSTLPAILMILGICVTRLMWIWTVFPNHRTLECIYMCYPISWIVTSIIQFVYWFFAYNRLMSQD